MKFLSITMSLFLLVSSSINAQFKRKNEIDNLLTSISKNNPLPTFVAGGVNKTGVFYQYNHGNKIWSGKTPINENYARTHNDFIKYYRAQEWDRLDNYFTVLETAFGGDMTEYYEMMKERVEDYKVNPPGVYYDGEYIWDGIFRTNSK
jgi:hypothetical protein